MNKLIFKDNSTFEEAIRLLDDNGNGVLPVVDGDNKFIGLVTDGDIRKAILNNQLDLEHIINKNPYKLGINTSKQQRVQYLKKILRRQLPIVDEDNRFVEIFTFDDIEFNLITNPVIIMAGGLGTRLGELTKDTPKPMLKVGDKPILEQIIINFVKEGFYRFYISVNYLSEVIKDYFGDGTSLGIEIKYIEEKERLGTAGALSLIADEVEEDIIVSNGDVLTQVNFNQFLKYHLEKGSDATMCVREISHNVPYGVVECLDNKLISIKEKPKYSFNINAGIYALSPKILKKIEYSKYLDMPTLFEKTNDKYIFSINDYWIDIGQKDDYVQANIDAKK